MTTTNEPTYTLQITLSEQQAMDLQLAVTTFLTLAIEDRGKLLRVAIIGMTPESREVFKSAVVLSVLGGREGEITLEEGDKRMSQVCQRLTDLGVAISDWHTNVIKQREERKETKHD